MTRAVCRGVVWGILFPSIFLWLSGSGGLQAVHAQTRPKVRPAEQSGRKPPPAGLWRQSDRRPVVNRAMVEAQGIARFESRRLVLYSDIPRAQAEPLPALMDRAYEA